MQVPAQGTAPKQQQQIVQAVQVCPVLVTVFHDAGGMERHKISQFSSPDKELALQRLNVTGPPVRLQLETAQMARIRIIRITGQAPLSMIEFLLSIQPCYMGYWGLIVTFMHAAVRNSSARLAACDISSALPTAVRAIDQTVWQADCGLACYKHDLQSLKSHHQTSHVRTCASSSAPSHECSGLVECMVCLCTQEQAHAMHVLSHRHFHGSKQHQHHKSNSHTMIAMIAAPHQQPTKCKQHNIVHQSSPCAGHGVQIVLVTELQHG
jgi:hypothetical protein